MTFNDTHTLSLPDLFHLFLWLSPPPPGVAYFPQCIYPCVSCLSVPVRLVCLVKSTSVFFLYSFCYSPFSSSPGFDPCQFLDSVPACLTILPACHSVPSGLWSGFDLFACPQPFSYLPLWIIKHCKTPTICLLMCIWVSPCAEGTIWQTKSSILCFHCMLICIFM